MEEHEETVPEQFHLLIDLSDFAVQFRYESFEDLGGDLDRAEVVLQVGKLVEFVEKLIKGVEAAG